MQKKKYPAKTKTQQSKYCISNPLKKDPYQIKAILDLMQQPCLRRLHFVKCDVKPVAVCYTC